MLKGGAEPRKLVGDFFAVEDTVRNGAFLTAGDVNGDGRVDLAFGGGPNGGPRVRVIDGKWLPAAGGFTNLDQIGGAQISNLLSGDGNSRGGVRVSLRDVSGDGRADLVTGSGDKQASSVRLFGAVGLLGGGTDSSQVDPFGGVLANGVFVG